MPSSARGIPGPADALAAVAGAWSPHAGVQPSAVAPPAQTAPDPARTAPPVPPPSVPTPPAQIVAWFAAAGVSPEMAATAWERILAARASREARAEATARVQWTTAWHELGSVTRDAPMLASEIETIRGYSLGSEALDAATLLRRLPPDLLPAYLEASLAAMALYQVPITDETQASDVYDRAKALELRQLRPGQPLVGEFVRALLMAARVDQPGVIRERGVIEAEMMAAPPAAYLAALVGHAVTPPTGETPSADQATTDRAIAHAMRRLATRIERVARPMRAVASRDLAAQGLLDRERAARRAARDQDALRQFSAPIQQVMAHASADRLPQYRAALEAIRRDVPEDHAPVVPLTRPLGAELEMVWPDALSFEDRETLVTEALARVGITAVSDSPDYRSWAVKSDGSVHGDHPLDLSRGTEVVSPVLVGAEGQMELRKVCRALTAAGAMVNLHCGGHIHMGVLDLVAGPTNPEGYRRQRALIRNYGANERVINTVLAPRRRHGGYGGSALTLAQDEPARAPDAAARRVGRERLEGVLEAPETIEGAPLTSAAAAALCLSKQSKVKMTGLAGRTASIEFRQAEGTLDPDRILQWAVAMEHLVNSAVLETDRVAVLGVSRAGGRAMVSPTGTRELAEYVRVGVPGDDWAAETLAQEQGAVHGPRSPQSLRHGEGKRAPGFSAELAVASAPPPDAAHRGSLACLDIIDRAATSTPAPHAPQVPQAPHVATPHTAGGAVARSSGRVAAR